MRRILRRWRRAAGAEEAASEQPGQPRFRGMGGEVVVRMAVLSSLLLPLAVPLPSLPPFLLLSPCLLPLAWRLERVSGEKRGHPLFLGATAAGRRGREGCGGAGEWLFVLECDVVQRAVEPWRMRDRRACVCVPVGVVGKGLFPLLPLPSVTKSEEELQTLEGRM